MKHIFLYFFCVCIIYPKTNVHKAKGKSGKVYTIEVEVGPGPLTEEDIKAIEDSFAMVEASGSVEDIAIDFFRL